MSEAIQITDRLRNSRTLWYLAGEFAPAALASTANRRTDQSANPRASTNGRTVGAPLIQTAADGIRMITIAGVMLRSPTIQDLEDNDVVTDVESTTAAVNAAAADPSVKGVMMLVNSPGGAVDGAHQLADAVHALSKSKPTATFYDNIGASAALLVGSQTKSSSAYKSTLIGSIGTRIMLYDLSGLFAKMGVEAIAIDSGGMKSAAAPGTAITPEQRDYFRAIVNQLSDQFVADVARGRGISLAQSKSLADGKVHVAPEAQALGLIDHLETFPQAMARLKTAAGSSRGAGTASGSSGLASSQSVKAFNYATMK